MATAQQIEALVRSHIRRDDDMFRQITLQIAAHMAALKSTKAAERLRGLVNNAAIPILPQNVHGLLEAREDLADLTQIVLSHDIAERLRRVVREHEKQHALLDLGLRPSQRLLFTGPPGVGKTMAAGALAKALRLPLFRVSLHAVISQYLGATAASMAKVFETARTVPAVYLLDEIDAVAGSRMDNTRDDVAEMRRQLNSLLMFVEDFRGPGVLIGATNIPGILDPAIFRRFDAMIEFTPPDFSQVTALLVANNVDACCVKVHDALAGRGHADLCAAIDAVRRDHVIDGTPIDTDHIVTALHHRRKAA